MGDTTAASRLGVRRLPGGLPDRERRALIEEAEGLAFTAPHPSAGGWFAGVDLAVPRVGDAVRPLTDAAAAHGPGFVPNAASFQRYEPGGNGLPPHRVDPPASAPRLMFQLRRLAAPDSPEWSPEFSAAERAQAIELLGRRA